MKRIILIFTLLASCMMGFAQGCLDPLLSQTLNSKDDNEKLEVVVLMKSQYDRSQLSRCADFFPTKAERRDFVVNELKAFAETSQRDLKNLLAEMEQQGTVSSVRSLWSANALYFSATKPALLNLSERIDIETISLNTKHQLIPEGETAEAASALREITPNLTQVNADQVWAMGYTGAGVVVGVVDSGVNYDHLDLADHLWDGGEAFPHHGYDIVNDLDGVIDEFDRVVGLDRLKAIHLNDSLNTQEAHKDRHACIGKGKIGLEALVRVINHPKLRDLPFYLETPNDLDGYRAEITLLRGRRT